MEAIRSFWLFKESITTSGTEAQLDKNTQRSSRLPKFIFNSMYMVYVHLTLQFIEYVGVLVCMNSLEYQSKF